MRIDQRAVRACEHSSPDLWLEPPLGSTTPLRVAQMHRMRFVNNIRAACELPSDAVGYLPSSSVSPSVGHRGVWNGGTGSCPLPQWLHDSPQLTIL